MITPRCGSKDVLFHKTNLTKIDILIQWNINLMLPQTLSFPFLFNIFDRNDLFNVSLIWSSLKISEWCTGVKVSTLSVNSSVYPQKWNSALVTKKCTYMYLQVFCIVRHGNDQFYSPKQRRISAAWGLFYTSKFALLVRNLLKIKTNSLYGYSRSKIYNDINLQDLLLPRFTVSFYSACCIKFR